MENKDSNHYHKERIICKPRSITCYPKTPKLVQVLYYSTCFLSKETKWTSSHPKSISNEDIVLNDIYIHGTLK